MRACQALYGMFKWHDEPANDIGWDFPDSNRQLGIYVKPSTPVHIVPKLEIRANGSWCR